MKQEILAGIVLCAIGACLLLVPSGTLWRVTEKWKTQNGNGPSKSYTVLMKVLGAVFGGTGAGLLIYGLILFSS